MRVQNWSVYSVDRILIDTRSHTIWNRHRNHLLSTIKNNYERQNIAYLRSPGLSSEHESDDESFRPTTICEKSTLAFVGFFEKTCFTISFCWSVQLGWVSASSTNSRTPLWVSNRDMRIYVGVFGAFSIFFYRRRVGRLEKLTWNG